MTEYHEFKNLDELIRQAAPTPAEPPRGHELLLVDALRLERFRRRFNNVFIGALALAAAVFLCLLPGLQTRQLDSKTKEILLAVADDYGQGVEELDAEYDGWQELMVAVEQN